MESNVNDENSKIYLALYDKDNVCKEILPDVSNNAIYLEAVI